MEVPQSWNKSGAVLGIKTCGFETWFLLVTSLESFSKLLTLPPGFHTCKNGVETNYLMRFLQGLNGTQFGKLWSTLQTESIVTIIIIVVVLTFSTILWGELDRASWPLSSWRNQSWEGLKDLPKVTKPWPPAFLSGWWTQRFHISFGSIALEMLKFVGL